MKSRIGYIFILIAGAIAVFIIYPKINVSVEKDSDSKNSTEDLIRTDKEFSQKSIDDGIAAAFTAYADKDVILMRDKQFPIKGIEKLKEHYSKIKKGNAKLEWAPVKAEIAGSGEMGYTFGNWVYTDNDTEGKESKAYGNYVTIWKKQKDKNWKFVLDGGNTTPPPDNKKLD
jgi:ketosteroid isomerase-like protein